MLTFTARASYRLGRHLNISALPEARVSHTLGQPQPQLFKYFVLNIFRAISLILSTTLEDFPALCSNWSTRWEKTTCIHFLYEAVCTQPGSELITHPEEPCQLWCIIVCDLETSWMRRPWHTGWAVVPKTNKQTNKQTNIYVKETRLGKV